MGERPTRPPIPLSPEPTGSDRSVEMIARTVGSSGRVPDAETHELPCERPSTPIRRAPPSTIGRPAKRSPRTARDDLEPSDARDDNQPSQRRRQTAASTRRSASRWTSRQVPRGSRCCSARRSSRLRSGAERGPRGRSRTNAATGRVVLNTRADTHAGRASGGGGKDPILANSEADRAFRPSVVATAESRPLVSFRRVHAYSGGAGERRAPAFRDCGSFGRRMEEPARRQLRVDRQPRVPAPQSEDRRFLASALLRRPGRSRGAGLHLRRSARTSDVCRGSAC